MGTISINIANPTLDRVYEFDGGDTCVIDLRCGTNPVSISGPTLLLREVLGDALEALNEIARNQAMRQHPSFPDFTPQIVSDCEGSWMPDGSIWLTPAQAAAVAHINEAIDALSDDDLTFEPRTTSMMRERDVQADELGGDAA